MKEYLKPCVYKQRERKRPRTFCRTGLRVTVCSEVKSVEKCGDELWIAEKFQSNSEIAGSPRNSFRASLVRDYWG